MGEWKTYRNDYILSQICYYINNRSSSFDNYISTENMLPNKGGVCEAANVPSGTVIEYKVGDILISNIRPYFQKIWRADRNGGCSADVLCIRAKENVDSKYLYYLLSQQAFFDYVMSGAKGCKMPRGDKKQIMQWPVTLPPLEEQRRIAGILGSLDDKIELNRRINANLETQAQALFRSWFVDFEPFRDGPFVDSELGKIPQGWKICRLKDATKEIIRGFTSKYVERSDLINLNQKVNKGQYLDRQYYKFLNPEIAIPTNKFAQQNDILLNSLGQGTLGRVHYYGELTPNIVIDQHITIIRANNTTFQPSFIYLFLSSNKVQHSIEGMVTGSTGMQMLNISQVREMNILQPDVNTMNKFHNIVQPFFVEIRKNNSETEIIAKIRDTLLPKLMAGEIAIE